MASSRSPHSDSNSTTTSGCSNGINAHGSSSGNCPHCGLPHSKQCVLSALAWWTRIAIPVFGIKVAASLLIAALKGRLRRAPLGRFVLDGSRFAAFVGTCAALTRGVRCAIARWRGVDDSAGAALAGAVGGAGILLDGAERRRDIALLATARALQVVASAGVRTGALPLVPGASMLTFAASNVFILYSLFFEPGLLDAGYYGWITKLVGVGHDVLSWTLRDTPVDALAGAAAAALSTGMAIPTAARTLPLSVLGSAALPPRVFSGALPGRMTLPSLSLTAAQDELVRVGHARDASSIGEAAAAAAVAITSGAAGATVPIHANPLLRSAAESLSRLRPIPTALQPLPRESKWIHAALVEATQQQQQSQLSHGALYRPCDVVWHASGVPCAAAHTADAAPLFLRCLRVYGPVHGLPLLAFHGGDLLKNPVATLGRLARNVFFSSAFLTAFATTAKIALCTVRTSLRRDDVVLIPLLASASSAAALLFESPGRATELALFVLPRGGQAAWMIAARAGWLPSSVPCGFLALFCGSMAVLNSAERADLKTGVAWLRRAVFGSGSVEAATQKHARPQLQHQLGSPALAADRHTQLRPQQQQQQRPLSSSDSMAEIGGETAAADSSVHANGGSSPPARSPSPSPSAVLGEALLACEAAAASADV